MTFDAIFGLERVFAVMAGAAGFTFVHIAHLGFECSCFEREYLGMAVGALEHAEMEFVAEACVTGFGLERDNAWFVPFVALVALTGYGECILAIVAGAAGFAGFHTCHGCLE